jgi:hypothetical protein
MPQLRQGESRPGQTSKLRNAPVYPQGFRPKTGKCFHSMLTSIDTSEFETDSMKSNSDTTSDVEMILPFLREDRRSRWRDLFPRPKGRKKLLKTLWNGTDFDQSLMLQVDPRERTVQQLSSRLRSLGAPSLCHLISARPSLDGQDLELISALRMVLDLAPGTIICCIPGTLAYYENDDRNGNYIILRRKNSLRCISGIR